MSTQAVSPNRSLRTPADYRSSLRDGRRVFYRGEQVDDVTTHHVLRHAVDHAALDYEMAQRPELKDIVMAPDGSSRYYHVPRDADDLLSRSRLIEAATRAGKTL